MQKTFRHLDIYNTLTLIIGGTTNRSIYALTLFHKVCSQQTRADLGFSAWPTFAGAKYIEARYFHLTLRPNAWDVEAAKDRITHRRANSRSTTDSVGGGSSKIRLNGSAEQVKSSSTW